MAANEEDNFYEFFDQNTATGRILEVDVSSFSGALPPKALTSEEWTARSEWTDRWRNVLVPHYLPQQPRVVRTGAELLKERICPPRLVLRNASTRYNRDGSKPMKNHPPEIHAWEGFRQSVAAFVAPAATPATTMYGGVDEDIFARTLLGSKKFMRGEAQEQAFLLDYVFVPLRETGLIQFPDDNEVERMGLPDLLLTRHEAGNPRKATLVIEKKIHSKLATAHACTSDCSFLQHRTG